MSDSVHTTLGPDELALHPAFQAVPAAALARAAASVRRTTFTRGDLLCRQGERATTAFLVESGRLDIHAAGGPGLAVWAMEKVASVLDHNPRHQHLVTLDRPVWGALGPRIGTLGKDDLFGETNVTRSRPDQQPLPRPASLRAATDGTCLELGSHALLHLRTHPRYQVRLDRAYSRQGAHVELEGVPLTVEDLLPTTEFSIGDGPGQISPRSLRDYPGMVVMRHFRAGEIICREGEFGSTAYFIHRGEVDVRTLEAAARVKPAQADDSPTMTSEEPPSDDSRFGERVRSLGPGELFGEIGCLNFYPRTGTVIARTDCAVFEMLRWFLEQLLRPGHPFKARLDASYRERSLGSHLKQVALFADLDEASMNWLRQRARLETLTPFVEGQARLEKKRDDAECTLWKVGDVADSLVLVRLGTLKVSQRAANGHEVVLGYVGRGQVEGHAGLFSESGRHPTTLVALDRVELVRILKADLDELSRRCPSVREQLDRWTLLERELENRRTLDLKANLRGAFVAHGLGQAQDILLVDLDRCTRCDECVRACAQSHGGVNRFVREGLRFDRYLVTNACRSCLHPLCMIGCPVGSIRRDVGKQVVIEDWCIGCGKCTSQCSHGALQLRDIQVLARNPVDAGTQLVDVKRQAFGCDLCHDLDGGPRCVMACPEGAATRTDPRLMFDDLTGGLATPARNPGS